MNTSRIKLWSLIFWLAVWQTASSFMDQQILLPAPLTVLRRLSEIAFTSAFWSSIFFSLGRIFIGFTMAMIAGTVFAAISSRFIRIQELLAPLVLIMKTVPVASFIILALIWISSKNLSILISFIMVFPVVYTNVLDGICSIEKELLEMAQVFELSPIRSIRFIYVSQVLPFFRSACSVTLGLCWKSGIAAEVIGIPKGSIGEKLYTSKIYLNTPDLFAWTLIIVFVSLLFEKLLLALIDVCVKRIERM